MAVIDKKMIRQCCKRRWDIREQPKTALCVEIIEDSSMRECTEWICSLDLGRCLFRFFVRRDILHPRSVFL